MSKSGQEEKFPLLLYFVESNDDLYQTNKRLYFDKSRFHGITSGASAVFRQFPNYIGTCWVATALTGLLFFMLVLIMMSAMTTGVHRIPRCTAKEELNNSTIHLVHTHHPDEWKPLEVELFEKIVQTYPKYKIHLIVIQNSYPQMNLQHADNPTGQQNIVTTSLLVGNELATITEGVETSTSRRIPKRKKRKIDDLRLSINMGAKRLLDILLHGKSALYNSTDKFGTTDNPVKTTRKVRTVEDLLKIHPNIILENTTYNQIFFMSPLYAYWPFLNENLKVFAVRTVQLWQYGGITFDLEPNLKDNATSDNKTSDVDNIFNKKLMNFIISEKNNYEKLPTGVVTADDEALHMESKIPCHAFFGEIMMNLRRATPNTTVKDILQESLKVFCRHSAADKKYCDILKKMN